MRTIDSIIIHCSATPCGQDFTAADIDRWHRQRSFNGIGYHFVIRLDGTIENGRAIEKPGAHCVGWNNRSIGICYIGGLDACGHPADTRTPKQKEAMKTLINRLQREYFGIRSILGHRDTSPDLNGDGRIEPNEFIKACPCFDVRTWLRSVSLATLCTGMFFLATSCGSHKSSIKSSDKTESRLSSQTMNTEQQEQRKEVLQKEDVDSSSFHHNSFEEDYIQQTTVIHRKKQYVSALNRKHDSLNTDTTQTINNRQTAEYMKDSETTQSQSKEDKRSRKGNPLLLLAGSGAATAVLILYSRNYRRKKANTGNGNRLQA